MDDFANAIRAAERDMGGKGIGTLGEKSLHLALKYYFAPDAETHEKQLSGFVADAITEDGVIEIQTRGLSRLKPKLDALLPYCPVTVVHPVAAEKWLCRIDENGELLSKRKSPKHESVYTAMREIYTLRDYLENSHFCICICAVELAEYSVERGKSRREKLDRVPLRLQELWRFASPEDYAALLPASLQQPFTATELSSAIRAPEMQTRMLVNLLVKMGMLTESGKKGRSKQWSRSVSDSIGG